MILLHHYRYYYYPFTFPDISASLGGRSLHPHYRQTNYLLGSTVSWVPCPKMNLSVAQLLSVFQKPQQCSHLSSSCEFWGGRVFLAQFLERWHLSTQLIHDNLTTIDRSREACGRLLSVE
jgi:hypothetical protein